jgi:glucosylceramidase
MKKVLNFNYGFKIPFVKMAQRLSPHELKLFSSPWIAPDWIKTNISSNKLKGDIGGEYYQYWANYFVK